MLPGLRQFLPRPLKSNTIDWPTVGFYRLLTILAYLAAKGKDGSGRLRVRETEGIDGRRSSR
jgi:hypothetical protein